MNRSVFPDDFTNVKLLLREALFIKKATSLQPIGKIKGMVFVISAIHDHKCNDGDDTISKLKIIIKCNKLLGRVNKCNQYLTYY